MANKPATERSWDSIIRQADPDYDRARRNEVEFEFSNDRKFKANRALRHPYDRAEEDA